MRNPIEVPHAEAAPDVLRWAAQRAATCRDCGEVHEYRLVSPPGHVLQYSWAHPVDGHAYRKAATEPVISWLKALADHVESQRRSTGA